MRLGMSLTCVIGVAVACGGSDGEISTDTGGVDPGPLVLQVLSPTAGSTVELGENVLLSASASSELSGESVALDSLEWRLNTGDWSAMGNEVTVNDFPAGVHQLIATGRRGPREATDAIDLVVEGGSAELSGQLRVTLEVSDGQWTVDDDCDVPVVLLMDNSSFAGTSAVCEFFEQFEDYKETIEWIISGTEESGVVSGELGVADGEENIPFEGSWDPVNKVLNGSFDVGGANTDGEVRFYGSLEASAQ